jgi:hypothetical protein
VPLQATIGDAPGALVVEGEDLGRPCDDGVAHGVELGDGPGGVEVAEAVQGAGAVVGRVEPVSSCRACQPTPIRG